MKHYFSFLDVICQGHTIPISCSNGQVIQILEGWYGHDTSIANNCPTQNQDSTKCGVNATNALAALCSYNRGCQISAIDSRFPKTDCAANTGNLNFNYKCVEYSMYLILITN